MSDQFIAEIRMFGFNFPPAGWAFCQGQLLSISQNTALFSLLGTNFGGDGKSTFGLPNMQGNAAMGVGEGPGLSPRFLGESGGYAGIMLTVAEIPQHNHALNASQGDANSRLPNNQLLATGIGIGQYGQAASGQVIPLNQKAIAPAGNSAPHNNLMPYVTLNFCIALQGIFPPRD